MVMLQPGCLRKIADQGLQELGDQVALAVCMQH